MQHDLSLSLREFFLHISVNYNSQTKEISKSELLTLIDKYATKAEKLEEEIIFLKRMISNEKSNTRNNCQCNELSKQRPNEKSHAWAFIRKIN